MTALLEARGIGRRYGTVDALRDVSMIARRGEATAILGPSGAGKSTLIRILHLLEAPDAGLVRVDGVDAPIDRRERLLVRRRFALVQQRPGFLDGSVRMNVAFPLRARGMARDAAVRDADRRIDDVGLSHRRDAHVATLSGGEAQRAGLARALVTRPDLLLLDEFTNQLDPVNGDLAERLVEDALGAGAAAVFVTHSIGEARRLADHVVFLDQGGIVEAGPALTVLSTPATELVRRFMARA